MALPKYTEPHYRIWHYIYLFICGSVFFFLIAPLFVIFPLSFNAEEFLVITDHQPLKSIFNKKDLFEIDNEKLMKIKQSN